LEYSRTWLRRRQAANVHGADCHVSATLDEVLLEMHPALLVAKLYPGLNGRVRHRQNVDVIDAKALRKFRGDARRPPAGREQLGPPQMRGQVDVAQPKPGLAPESFERVHALERVAAWTPTPIFVNHTRQRVQDGVHV